MILNWTRRDRVPRAIAPAALNEHHAIKKIGRLLVMSIAALALTCAVLLATGFQVRLLYEHETAAAEHVRAANAIDLVVGRSGPLRQSDAALIGRIAGLNGAHLSSAAPSDPNALMIPLLGEQSLFGSYLVWGENPFANDMFRHFAPIRLPVVDAMLLFVAGLMLHLRRLVGDIERQRRLAHRQSRTDVVTGLGNRLALDSTMDELGTAAIPFGIVILDLDRFKAVNDALGHAAGDVVLRTVGQRLATLLGPQDQLVRLGGDEFVIVAVSTPGADALDLFARECIFAIEQPIDLAGRTVRIGTSLGIVAAGSSDLPPAILLGAADAALYRAKAMQGSSFQFAGETHSDQTSWHLRCA